MRNSYTVYMAAYDEPNEVRVADALVQDKNGSLLFFNNPSDPESKAAELVVMYAAGTWNMVENNGPCLALVPSEAGGQDGDN